MSLLLKFSSILDKLFGNRNTVPRRLIGPSTLLLVVSALEVAGARGRLFVVSIYSHENSTVVTC